MCKFFFSFLFTLSVFFTAEAQGFSDFSSVTMDGRTISFADYQGKVILVVQSYPISVNAWQCDDFEDMQRCYGDLGFQVLEFLCDDLNEEILPGGGKSHFLTKERKVSYPRFAVPNSKDNAILSYLYNTQTQVVVEDADLHSTGGIQGFNKVLLDRSGKIVRIYPLNYELYKIREDIKKFLHP